MQSHKTLLKDLGEVILDQLRKDRDEDTQYRVRNNYKLDNQVSKLFIIRKDFNLELVDPSKIKILQDMLQRSLAGAGYHHATANLVQDVFSRYGARDAIFEKFYFQQTQEQLSLHVTLTETDSAALNNIDFKKVLTAFLSLPKDLLNLSPDENGVPTHKKYYVQMFRPKLEKLRTLTRSEMDEYVRNNAEDLQNRWRFK